MPPRRELLAFAAALALVLAGVFHESLFLGKVLSPADVVYVEASFREFHGARYEPANRLLMDPVLQFQPWLEFNRALLRTGRLPLWNPLSGCGAPHLANGQSAVFDPFHLIAYLGTLPDALAQMAFARLFVAGLGMFLLARAWGLGVWGRWFTGLAFPLCGFLMAWLLYPVANVALWMPWLFLATDRVLDRPEARGVAALATAVGLVLLGGHVQTSAHVLLAAAAYAGWRARAGSPLPAARRSWRAWMAGTALGMVLGAIEIVPLGVYLTKSPVWADRAAEKRPAGAIERPRLWDAARTALPYALGSQRRGQPNLARALVGAHNLNEAAGGFAGLGTLLWLAPLGWAARRTSPRARFLAALATVGAMGAFGVAPVANLLRMVPVLDVTDNRRLTLWLAFGLVLLGGIGLDHLDRFGKGRGWRSWTVAWAVAGLVLILLAAGSGLAEGGLRRRAIEHYAQTEEGRANPVLARDRAELQIRAALAFLPRYSALAGMHLLMLASLATALRRGRIPPRFARGGALMLTLADLLGFGVGLNPAIARKDDRPVSAVIAYLRRECPPPARIIAVGAELPPNLLLRYGLADVRNYDSVELSRSVDWFAPLFEPEPGRRARTSRRTIAWAGITRSRGRLAAAGVSAVVGATPPPAGAFARVDRVGSTWVARLPTTADTRRITRDPGRIEVVLPLSPAARDPLVLHETYDPGWRAEVDGEPVAIHAHLGTFLGVRLPRRAHRLILRYDPPEVRLALGLSLAALVATTLAAGWGGWPKMTENSLGRVRAGGLESNLVIPSRSDRPDSTEG